MTDQLDRAAEALRDAREVALACHINPDPDALGSMLGLATFLQARGTKVVSVSGNVRRPGNYEIELGIPSRDIVYGLAGGPPEGR